MIVLKIGGSVITDKSRGVFERARIEVIDFIVREISENLKDDLILVHGAGSFGHPYVEKFRLKEEKNPIGVIRTHIACKKLNTIVCNKMLEYGLKPYPIHPLSSFRIREDLIFDKSMISMALEEGFIPVIHGDIVYNELNRRFEVLSGDDIVVSIAKCFEVKRVGFAIDRDGVILDGRVVREINANDVLRIGDAEGKSDVTGGMRGKVEKIIKAGINAFVFNAREVGRFLRGEFVGTLIRSR